MGRRLYPLVRPTLRALRWVPLLAGAALGTAAAAVPPALTDKLTATAEANLLRIGGICAALGTAFLLDDPASRSTPTVPMPRLARNAVRVGLVLPVLAAWWAGTLWLTTVLFGHLKWPALSVETGALLAVAVALAAAVQRGGADGSPGVVAGPIVLVLAALVWVLPPRFGLAVAPDSPQWTAAHHRWAGLLLVALLAFLIVGREGRPRRVAHRPKWTVGDPDGSLS